MKYEKARVEVICFGDVDFFAYSSELEAKINNAISDMGCMGFSGISSDGSFTCTSFPASNGQTIPGTYGFVLHQAYNNWQVFGV